MESKFIGDNEMLRKFSFTGRPMDIGYYFSQLYPYYSIEKIDRDNKRFGYIVWYKERSKNDK